MQLIDAFGSTDRAAIGAGAGVGIGQVIAETFDAAAASVAMIGLSAPPAVPLAHVPTEAEKATLERTTFEPFAEHTASTPGDDHAARPLQDAR